MSTQKLIHRFYTAFQQRDYRTMADCYHDSVRFEDPAFGVLQGKEAAKMWEMLLSHPGAKTTIEFSQIEANDQTGSAHWEAKYVFGPKKRIVHNVIEAQFTFAEGKILTHTDSFDLWNWSRQALGLPGLLLGWSDFFRKKLQAKTNSQLARFMTENPAE